MTVMSICEHGVVAPGPVVNIDGQGLSIAVTDPFGEKEEKRLEWYFEKLLLFPFVDQVKSAGSSDQHHGLRRDAFQPGVCRPRRL